MKRMVCGFLFNPELSQVALILKRRGPGPVVGRWNGLGGKRLHHIITTAAACLNWHGARTGNYTDMRPGIDGDAAMSAQKGGAA